MLLLLQSMYYFSLLLAKSGLWFIDLSESKHIFSVTACVYMQLFACLHSRLMLLFISFNSYWSKTSTPLSLDDIIGSQICETDQIVGNKGTIYECTLDVGKIKNIVEGKYSLKTCFIVFYSLIS